MGYEIHIIIFYTLVLAGLGAAWVGGYLDRYQSKAQDYALGKMGENKASYGLKSAFQQWDIIIDCSMENRLTNWTDPNQVLRRARGWETIRNSTIYKTMSRIALEVWLAREVLARTLEVA